MVPTRAPSFAAANAGALLRSGESTVSPARADGEFSPTERSD
jgi:hypothetical protein